MKNKIKLLSFIGIGGALIMLIGDMFLYYTNSSVEYFHENILNIMGSTSYLRQVIGGFVGPVAAFMYCFGFYLIYLIGKKSHKRISKIILTCQVLAMFLGGAYHSHFTFLGIGSAHLPVDGVVVSTFQNYMQFFSLSYFALQIVASGLLIYMSFSKKSFFPKRYIIVNPILLLLIQGLFSYLPKPIGMILVGGWFNFIFIILFSLTTFVALKLNSKKML